MTMLSTLGMYNYDSTLFDNLALPNGVNKEDVIDSILFETAELELLYTDFDFLKDMIGLWSKREMITWDKMLELFEEEYNPLYNVDAYETLTENRDLYGTSKDASNRNLTSDEDGTNIKQVSGFNDEGFKNSEKVIDDITTKDVESSTSNGETTDKGTITTTNRRYGNIGITMSQQMAEAEIRVRPKMNIIKYITESFKNRFCLLVY